MGEMVITKVYKIEEFLNVKDLDKLIEKGETFDVVWEDREELHLLPASTNDD